MKCFLGPWRSLQTDIGEANTEWKSKSALGWALCAEFSHQQAAAQSTLCHQSQGELQLDGLLPLLSLPSLYSAVSV